jgi:phosphoadenosine phosphosulfate reductase
LGYRPDQNIYLRNVPYNELLDKGYRSIGDWHSTAQPSADDAAAANTDNVERAGRWSGRNKSECGLHKDYFQMKAAFEAKNKDAAA